MKIIFTLILLCSLFSCRTHKAREIKIMQSTIDYFGDVENIKAWAYENEEDKNILDTFYILNYKRQMKFEFTESESDGDNYEYINYDLKGTGEIKNIATEITSTINIDKLRQQYSLFDKIRKIEFYFNKREEPYTYVFFSEIADTTINNKNYKDLIKLNLLLDRISITGNTPADYFHTYYWDKNDGLIRYIYFDINLEKYQIFNLVQIIK